MRLWSLHRDHEALLANISKLEQTNSELKARVKHAGDPAFLEREARDRFDLVSEGDLVFIFSEDEGP
jgi:cell division protein FtsB